MIQVNVANKWGMVDVYFRVTGEWPRVNAESNIPSPKAVLWGDMPVGMVGIDGDEVFSGAMRQVSAQYGRNAVDVE